MNQGLAIVLNYLLGHGHLPPSMRPPVIFGYTNHKGETATRSARPVHVWFGSTEHHPNPSWLLHAWDVDRQAYRDFDLARMGVVQPEPGDGR